MALILLVEDDDLLRETLRDSLELDGHSVIEAADGAEGVRLVNAHAPDLVITDLLMPEMEGMETIIALRRTGLDLKIIAISGGGRAGPVDYLRTAEKLGADRVLAKPFRQRELRAAVEDVLG